ncbi:hypothetical protein ACFFVB_18325 [Formosa undariae]|uniref:Helix-turn-helix domain-containing protein n=1 Tax=Formosa undariae TaxID=1325436 RepID=A0ABV5F7F4_9FLAO
MKTPRNKAELTPTEQTYVTNNYTTTSMNDMCAKLDVPYSRVRKFMRLNNLTLSPEQLKHIIGKYHRSGSPKREAVSLKPKPQPQHNLPFWERRINHVTGFPVY